MSLAPLLRFGTRYRFTLLLVALMLFLLTLPIADVLDTDAGTSEARPLEVVAFIIMLAAAAGSVTRRAVGRFMALLLALPAAVLTMWPAGLTVQAWEVVRYLACAAFLCYVIVRPESV
jgi:hypothetical protein